MLIKLGVDISRLNREIRRALPVIERVFKSFGKEYESVITSTYEGNHHAGSLHYADDAVDIRVHMAVFAEATHLKLKTELGKDYDVVWHKSHYHIEYDPKP
jgi:hypothetical protein